MTSAATISADMRMPALVFTLLCLFNARVLAVGPHEILLLINSASSDSALVGESYAKLRSVPDSNIVRLEAPDGATTPEISNEQFMKRIMEPAQASAEERRIADHILAWVLAPGFPTRIAAKPPVSITGAVFMRGMLPDPAVVDKGTYASPLFAGPVRPNARQFGPQTLDAHAEWLRSEMPLPCMMLGVGGPLGNTAAEILRCLRAGVESDATRPKARVVFQTSDDIRSRCREWQFAPVAEELSSMDAGLRAVVTNGFPDGAADLLGFMAGAATIAPEGRLTFVPGAMAEHLTSLAADFTGPGQTKISAWIRAGATATAGAVAEPYSAWQKFPAARFYVHYASGCAMIEALYQSVRCPLQILPVGDPLASPYRTAASLEIVRPAAGAGEAPIVAEAVARADRIEHYGRFVWLCDGVKVGENRKIVLDPGGLPAGTHRLRCIAYRTGLVRQQVFDECDIAGNGKKQGGR